MLEIVDALPSDAIELASQLRPIDKLEVEATGNTPEKSLTNSFNLPKSKVYSGVDSDRKVVFMCGVSQCPNNPKNGVIWMLTSELAKEHKLRKLLEPLLDQYDDILIDCSPSLGTLTINALTASNGVLIPMECEYFAVLGLGLVRETIDKVKSKTNPHLEIDGILATMFERKTAHSREVLELIYKEFPDDLLDTIISRTVRFSESTVKGEPITTYASSSTGAVSYRRLARELIHRGGAK